MGIYKVDFYRYGDGSCPVADYLDSLNQRMRAKVMRTISLLEELGPELREPHSKPLGDGIFELRAGLGSDAMRILYFFTSGRCIVLTNGFNKKTQKTPREMLIFAKQCRKAYLTKAGKIHE